MSRRITLIALSIAFTATDLARAEESEIDWRWREFQTWEYFATTAMLSGGFYLRFGAPHPEADWTGGILFDEEIIESAGIQSVDNRLMVTAMTDITYFGSMAYRLVDSVLVPGVGWQDWDTALQMSMIDLEAFGFVAITLWGLQASFGRERPYVNRCGDPEFYASESGCREATEPNRSFYAGHPAVALTAAGLTCTHHENLPLYGGGAGDTIACGTMLGVAVMNGFGRVMTEKHYASDLVVGFGVGTFAGFVLPRVLHYAHPKRPQFVREASTEPEQSVRVIAMPVVGADRLGLSLLGLF